MKKQIIVLGIILQIVFINLTFAYGKQPSAIAELVANILNRMSSKLTPQEIANINQDKLLAFISSEEKQALETGFLRFSINVPATIYLASAPGQSAPYWLSEQGFKKTSMILQSERDGEFEVWKKQFTAGQVGLGVNSVAGGGKHYVVFVKSDNKNLKISNLAPQQYQVDLAKPNVSLYVDRQSLISDIPASLDGAQMIKTCYADRDAGKILEQLFVTRYPSSNFPDQLLLTWESDPKTTQTISWRTDTTITQGYVAFQTKHDYQAFSPKPPTVTKSMVTRLWTRDIVNDPVVNRHSVTLTGLMPNTTYVYAVGDSIVNNWSDIYEFTTAPAGVKPFSFVYIGDPQNGLDRWGSLMQNACQLKPNLAFTLIAGDLVNRGAKRDDWDDFFLNAGKLAASKPFMPALGNHDCQGGHPTLYLQLFQLPTNGPASLEPERAYSFEYSNTLFIILDSNEDPEKQADWLDQQLRQSQAVWKFVVFHHPIYSSPTNRDNPEIRQVWLPIFDKHHVDMVLQGHDHAYLRTHPMKANQIVDSPKDGTIYVVSVSGTKMYTQGDYDYIAKGFTHTATYQILDIQVSGNRLVYRSYDIDNNIRDEEVIEK